MQKKGLFKSFDSILPIYSIHCQNTYDSFGLPVAQFTVTQAFDRNFEKQMKQCTHFSVNNVNG